MALDFLNFEYLRPYKLCDYSAARTGINYQRFGNAL